MLILCDLQVLACLTHGHTGSVSASWHFFGTKVCRFGGHEVADRQQAAGLLDHFLARPFEVAHAPG